LNMHHWFRLYYLQAMGAAIWSCSVDTILSFPAKTFITFFKNHGLLTVNNHPQWRTVKGGSREYVKRLSAPFQDKILYNCPVSQVRRDTDGVYIQDVHGKVLRYDEVIFSCHANEAIKMMADATSEEQNIIGAFGYQDNRVVVHSDVSFMPKRRGAWASWVYLSDSPKDNNASVSLSYWMNNLQSLETETPVIVTLNPGREPRSEFIHDTHVFSHPVFTQETYLAQEKIPSIQGKNRYWFCGAYQRYGFHEDGFLSAVNIVKSMGVDIPWMK
jgi:predicted NAD/FAD-binding protein